MASEHIIKSYDQELHRLDNIVAEMGGLAERMIVESVDALIRRDVALGNRVVSDGTIGRGPTKLISPRNTFHSSGNSSRLVSRNQRPNSVSRSASGRSSPSASR